MDKRGWVIVAFILGCCAVGAAWLIRRNRSTRICRNLIVAPLPLG